MKVSDLVKRDGILCGLCKQPVDLLIKSPHPLSATVGHIVPKARGGGDESENLRLEHWGCNGKKFIYLDSELDPKTLALPNPIIDVVAYVAATEKFRKGCGKGGKRTHELHPELAKKMGKLNGPSNMAKMPREFKVLGGYNRPYEARVRAGQIGGPKAIRKMSHEDHVRGGRNGSHEAKVWAGQLGAHIRRHLNRGVVSLDCKLCQGVK